MKIAYGLQILSPDGDEMLHHEALFTTNDALNDALIAAATNITHRETPYHSGTAALAALDEVRFDVTVRMVPVFESQAEAGRDHTWLTTTNGGNDGR